MGGVPRKHLFFIRGDSMMTLSAYWWFTKWGGSPLNLVSLISLFLHDNPTTEGPFISLHSETAGKWWERLNPSSECRKPMLWTCLGGPVSYVFNSWFRIRSQSQAPSWDGEPWIGLHAGCWTDLRFSLSSSPSLSIYLSLSLKKKVRRKPMF